MNKIVRAAFIYGALALILLYYRNDVTDWLQHGHAPLWLLFGAATLLAFIPVLPYKLVIGSLGIIYGPLTGAFLSWLASLLASIVLFALIRRYFQEQGRAYLSRFQQVERLSVLMERHPFVAIFMAKLVPLVPSMLVIIYPALLKVRLSTFVIASGLGKIPVMLAFAFLGHELLNDWQSSLLILGAHSSLILLVALLYRWWDRRTRHRES